VLGPNSLLYHRFAQGLRQEDEGCLTDAMVSLRLYPDEIRRMVEDTVMSWLFGTRGEAIATPCGFPPRLGDRNHSPTSLGRSFATAPFLPVDRPI
jgi:hypothetical protein